MHTWVLLLRAVNLGAQNKVSMPRLRSALAAAGLSDVSTYLQSGNIIARSALSCGELSRLVHDVVRDEFGVNTTLGASNLSFGMPDRPALTAAFLPLAAAQGLTSAIMDARTPQVVTAARAADLLLSRDDWGAAWIAAYRAARPPTPVEP